MRTILTLVVACLALCACGAPPVEPCPKPPAGAWRAVNVCQSDATLAVCQVGQTTFETGCTVDGFECVERCP